MILFYGAIGNAYMSLYMPKMPFKDELEMLTGSSAKDIIKKKKKLERELLIISLLISCLA